MLRLKDGNASESTIAGMLEDYYGLEKGDSLLKAAK
jgi:hypothetical protein